MSTWLVTGGAGYIGSHVCAALLDAGHQVVVIDDFSTGHPLAIPDNAVVVPGSVMSVDLLLSIMRDHRVDGVVHLAARKSVAESVSVPEEYLTVNVAGTLAVLRAMAVAGVRRMVLSSSAAVYGSGHDRPILEGTSCEPESPYGLSKLMAEQAVMSVSGAHGMSWIALRYFNVIGAGHPARVDRARDNIVPKVFRAISTGTQPVIYGDDYPTVDGTCVRDYLHVNDLAEAHVVAVRRLDEGSPVAAVYNVGCDVGVSVREVMDEISHAVGWDISPRVEPRRPGDPAILIASAQAIREDLGWVAKSRLRDMVASSWDAWQASIQLALGRPDSDPDIVREGRD